MILTSTKMAAICIRLFIFLCLSAMVSPATFTFVNDCGYTVWPGILSNAGTAPLPTTGFALSSGNSLAVSVPASWSGRLWGRTHCSQDETTGKFTCLTGDCGSGAVECGVGGPAPPATLAEFTLNGAGGLDFYDVSLVDGFNLPMLLAPRGGGGNCTVTGCVADINTGCPTELKVMGDGNAGSSCIACKSACGAFGDAQYCCSGSYGSPGTCSPNAYSVAFKNACPRAYSYAFDDATSTFTCSSADYVITFCPSSSTRYTVQVSQTTPAANSVNSGSRRTHLGFSSLVTIVAAAVYQIWFGTR